MRYRLISHELSVFLLWDDGLDGLLVSLDCLEVLFGRCPADLERLLDGIASDRAFDARELGFLQEAGYSVRLTSDQSVRMKAAAAESAGSGFVFLPEDAEIELSDLLESATEPLAGVVSSV